MFWLVKSLTSDYRRELTLTVNYVNLPPDVNLSSGLPDTFQISLSGTGWKFLSGNLFSQLGSLTIDLSFLSRQPAGVIAYPALRFVNRIPEFNTQDVKILRIEPDTLRFFLTENFSAKIPVLANAEVTCKNQFMVSGELKVIPDSIEIYGSLSAISMITSVKTDPLKLEMLSDPVDTPVTFQLPAGVRSNLKKQHVRLLVPVSEYAEKQVVVPVRQSSSMTGRYKFYPDKATLTFRMPVDKMKSVSASDFSVIAEMHSPESRYSRLICDKLPAGAVLFNLQPPFTETYRVN